MNIFRNAKGSDKFISKNGKTATYIGTIRALHSIRHILTFEENADSVLQNYAKSFPSTFSILLYDEDGHCIKKPDCDIIV